MAMTVRWTSRQGLECTDGDLSVCTCDKQTLSQTQGAIRQWKEGHIGRTWTRKQKELGLWAHSQT